MARDVQARRSPAIQAARRLLRHRMALLGGVILFVLGAAGILPPPVFPPKPPAGSRQFPLGTDELGRDVFSRVLYGGRISLLAGIGTTVLATLAGLLIGSISLFSTRADTIAMRSLDILFAFPPLLLAMAVVAVLGAGLSNAVLAITLVDAPRMARVVRGQMLSVK